MCTAFPLFEIIKNGGRGTKPTYKCMVIISLMAMELNPTLNGNPTNDIYWRLKSGSLIVVQLNTTSRPIIFYRQNLYSLTAKFSKPCYVFWNRAQKLFLSCYPDINFNHFLNNSKPCPGLEFRLIPKLIRWVS